MYQQALTLFTAIFFTFSCFGQQTYSVVNRTITTGNGSMAVHLNEKENNGIAWINGTSFVTGIIEFDIKGKDVFQQSFVGLAFHGVNDSTYEAIYFRPFNFRTADSIRKSHAVQYIASPMYDWFKLRNDYPNKYEQPVSPSPVPDDWFHVRLQIEDKKISVFVDHAIVPSLVVTPVVVLTGKKIGYWVGNGSGGDWKNLAIKSSN